MMIRTYLLLLSPLPLVGCSWTNTVWLDKPAQQKPSTKIELIAPDSRPAQSPAALVEAKGIKTWDSPGDLIGSNIEKAKEIGATHIWCPAPKEAEASLMALPPVPPKEAISLLKDFLIAITDLLKAVIALPVTFRSEAISSKTLLCAVYTSRPALLAASP